MKIAIVTTNSQPLPGKGKQITAPLAIAKNIAEKMKEKGHEVSIFASSDSETEVNLVSNTPSLEKNKRWKKVLDNLREKEKELESQNKSESIIATRWQTLIAQSYEFLLLSFFYEKAQTDDYDIIHFNAPFLFLNFASIFKTPIVFTLHDSPNYPFDTKALKLLYEEFNKDVNFVSISKSQRKEAPDLDYTANVYNGVDTKKFSFGDGGNYLAFAGRVVPKKGPCRAIEVAKETNNPLKIVGKTYSDYEDYWEKEVKVNLTEEITYEGLLPLNEMPNFYQNAKALINPIEWEEPFGLVPVEAMACGTPVIAFNRGAMGEIIQNGKTGFLVENKKEMIKAIGKIDEIDRKDCRKWVKENFSIKKMVDSYEKIYYSLLDK